MKLIYHKYSYFLELLISGLFILFYYIQNYSPQFFVASFIPNATMILMLEILVLLIPIVISISLLTQWNYYGSIESLLRRGTFTIIILIPLFLVWGDQQFTFWLASVHLLSSTISLYEKAPLTKETIRFKANLGAHKSWELSPPQLVLLSFFLLIIIGTTLLMLPIATNKNVPLIDHLFMVTSAACVTGLSTVNLGETYTYFGQIVLLLVIQIGGLGIMTLSAFISIFLGKSMAVKDRLVMQDILEISSLEQLVELILDIVKLTITIEIIGAVILTAVFALSGIDFANSLYLGVFHSVSAFCNAGLSPLTNGLEGYATNPALNFTVTSLIILGGIGFWVMKDIKKCFAQRKPLSAKFHSLTLHSKIVISTTFFLLCVGTLVIFVSEFMTTLAPYSLTEKGMVAYFLSVTSRTAGFNTVHMNSLTSSTVFFLIMLMFIGASPGSTGGGIKTTTFAVLWQSVKSTFLGKKRVELFHRTLDSSVIVKSIALTFTSMMLICFFMLFLLVFEHDKNPLYVLFEAVSAFATVGLSMGITSALTFMGKIFIIALMYIGRVGPLTMVVGLAMKSTKSEGLRYPQEKVIIG